MPLKGYSLFLYPLHVTYFSQWDSSKCDTGGGLKSTWVLPWVPGIPAAASLCEGAHAGLLADNPSPADNQPHLEAGPPY